MLAKEKNAQGSFSSNVLLAVATNILIGVLSLATGSLLARLLGVEGRGELAAIQTIPFFIASITQIGLPEALVYFSARNPHLAGRYYTSAIISVAVSSCLFVTLGYFIIPLVLAKQSPTIIYAATWYFIGLVPLWTLIGMAQNVMRGCKFLPIWNLMRILPLVGWLLVLLLCWRFDVRQPSLIASGFLLQMFLASIFLTTLTVKKIGGSFRPNRTIAKEMLSYGLPAMATTAPQLLNLRMDQMLMAGFLAPRFLGLYTVAVAWSGIVTPVLQGLGATLFPRIASLPTQTERDNAFAQGSRMAVLLAVGVALVLVFVTPLFLPMVFGAEFKNAIITAVILIVATAIAGVNTVMEEGLRGLGHPKLNMYAELAGLSLTILFLALFLRSWGIMGAAFASLAGYSTTNLFLSFQSKKLVHRSMSNLLIPTLEEILLLSKKLKVLVPHSTRI